MGNSNAAFKQFKPRVIKVIRKSRPGWPVLQIYDTGYLKLCIHNFKHYDSYDIETVLSKSKSDCTKEDVDLIRKRYANHINSQLV